MRLPWIFKIFFVLILFNINVNAMVRGRVEVGPDHKGKIYSEDEIYFGPSWYGPGWYNGIWFDSEPEYRRWHQNNFYYRGRYYPHHHRHHRHHRKP